MTLKHLIIGSAGVLLLLIGGSAGWMLRSDHAESPPASDQRALREQVEELTRKLDSAQKEAFHWQTLASRQTGARIDPAPPTRPASGDPAPVVRDATRIQGELAEALAAQDGVRLLLLLSELAALGEDHYPTVVRHWALLTSMDPARLDELGIGRIQLAAALVLQQEIMRYALVEAGVDPTFRQFTATTIEQAHAEVRRAILETLDFSAEKDKRVLHPLVRAARGFKDPVFVDRFFHLAERTDLYNNSRQSIAMMIAEIGGPESRRALDALRASGNHQRMMPILENIYAPPASGLLVWNAGSPKADRIGLNDIVLEYNDQRVLTMADLTRADASTKLGDKVRVKVLRNGVEQTIVLTVVNTAPGHLHFNATSIHAGH